MELTIGKRKIGDNHPAFIVAELSANHRQNFDLAVRTIEAMKKAGADAVKLQTYTPDTITLDCDNKYFQINQGTIWDGTTLHKLYQEAYTPWEWQPKLQKVAKDLGLIFFSTPFDETAVDFLDEMKVLAYKVASLEIVDIPLLEYIASKGKPMIISTGIAELSDIKLALDACHKMDNSKIALLKCVTEYPTPLEEINLRTLSDLRKKFKTIIGLSDHTLDINVTIAAVSLGAKIIEKHFILDRKLGGSDASFSLEPREFKAMVKAIRDTEKALGSSSYKLTGKMKKLRIFSPSIFAIKDIKEGESLTKENIATIRPAYGLAPKYWHKILGKRTNQVITKGTPIKWLMILK